ncbi:hypothetical protein VXJ26_27400 (plasmid) [Klebsiella pneumoniae]|nr:hypothetical protein [Klebsiella pneumoniae]
MTSSLLMPTTKPHCLARCLPVGNIDNTSKGKVLTQAIELSFSTPYIDFHFNYSNDDSPGGLWLLPLI